MMFDLSKIFDLSKKFALPDTLLKSKNYCTNNQNLLILKVLLICFLSLTDR